MFKKFKEKSLKFKIIFAFILGIVITTSVYAIKIEGIDVSFSSKYGLNSTNIQDAIDEVYDKTKKKTLKTICKRATKLHTETCSSNSYGCYREYNNGETITYGSLGTAGTLSTGDAFDCDVNGDGIYDSNTERFYYVSDLYELWAIPGSLMRVPFNDKYAVLIYSSNVSNGVMTSTENFAYASSGKNYEGPITAIGQLPTVNRWKNVRLMNNVRAIVTENGNAGTEVSDHELPQGFSYVGYSARLLNAMELYNTSCIEKKDSFTLGEIKKCSFLFENTSYGDVNSNKTNGYWLENPFEGYFTSFNVEGNIISIDANNVERGYIGDDNKPESTTKYGVRPVIDVAKGNMEY